jgi:hypothetical protein
MSASYTPIPTSDTDNFQITEKERSSGKSKTLRNRILVALACVIVLFLTFKAGQYAVRPTSPSDPGRPTVPEPSIPEDKKPISKPNNTMTHGGKRSVG